MMVDDVLEIMCPKCGNPHRYLLEIKHSIVLEQITIKSSYNPIQKSFKRLFSCPEKDVDFEAVILLIETQQSRIQSVKVKGITKDYQDDSKST